MLALKIEESSLDQSLNVRRLSTFSSAFYIYKREALDFDSFYVHTFFNTLMDSLPCSIASEILLTDPRHFC